VMLQRETSVSFHGVDVSPVSGTTVAVLKAHGETSPVGFSYSIGGMGQYNRCFEVVCTMEAQCTKCEAKCCRYFCSAIDQPHTYEDFEEVRWYLAHKGISVHVDVEGGWWIMVANRCRMLRKTPVGWRCKDYENRPLICRHFSPESCDFTLGDLQVDELFETPGELEAYARRMLGERQFDKARAKARRPKKPRRRRGAENAEKDRV